MDLQDEKCSGCGQPWAASTDPEEFESYETTAIQCHACAERGRAQRKMQEQGAEMDGLFMSVYKAR